MAQKKEQSALGRFLARAGIGGAIGAGMGALGGGKAGALKGLLAGTAMGGGSTAVGDAAFGVPKKGESGMLGEGKRGAVGGAAIGGLLGLGAVGADKGGMNLVKTLMQRGISKNKAIAMILGTGALAGAGSGALNQGIDQSLILGLDGDE